MQKLSIIANRLRTVTATDTDIHLIIVFNAPYCTFQSISHGRLVDGSKMILTVT